MAHNNIGSERYGYLTVVGSSVHVSAELKEIFHHVYVPVARSKGDRCTAYEVWNIYSSKSYQDRLL